MKLYDIVDKEDRPVSFLDFVPAFEYDGTFYKMSHGTFRNKISSLIREQLVEFDYRTTQTYYTLMGRALAQKKAPTTSKTKIRDPLTALVSNLPVEVQAIHNVRLSFQITGIWEILSSNSTLKMNEVSRDICMPPILYGNVLFRMTIHRTDKVTVDTSCSEKPISLDSHGLMQFLGHLREVANHLREFIDDSIQVASQQRPVVPDHKRWTVTMWHFGVDSAITYEGEMFCVTINRGTNGLLRAYAKTVKGRGTRIRLEKQEYPFVPLATAIENKIGRRSFLQARQSTEHL
jgi:hypothetical protein